MPKVKTPRFLIWALLTMAAVRWAPAAAIDKPLDRSELTERSDNTTDLQVGNRLKLHKFSNLTYDQLTSPEHYDTEKSRFVSDRRRVLIKALRKYYAITQKGDQQANFGIRLARLYMEIYFETLAQKRTPGKKAALETDAISYLHLARELYETIARDYPKHPRRDELLYSVGLSYLDEGSIDRGIAHFSTLAREYPTSKYINESLMQLSEVYFERNQFQLAESHLDKLLSQTGLPNGFLAYAQYKKAWCRYNQRDPKSAISYFIKAIDTELAVIQPGQARITPEVVRDIALPFSDLNWTVEAVAFYQGLGETRYRSGLESLAMLYYEKGSYPSAINLWEKLLAMNPDHISAPNYSLQIVHALELASQPTQAIDRFLADVPNYVSGSQWQRTNSGNSKQVKAVETEWESTFRKYALQFHFEAQRTHNKQRYELAERLYEGYLKVFPDTAFAPRLRFNLAEILFRDKQYWKAAAFYVKVYHSNSPVDFKEQALSSAVTALALQLNEERRQQGRVVIQSQTRATASKQTNSATESYSQLENTFLGAATEFVKAFPKSKESPPYMYDVAYLRYLHNDREKALADLKLVVDTYPRNAVAQNAAYLVLDVLNQEQNFPSLVKTCNSYLNHSMVGDTSFRREVASVLRRAELKEIQQSETNGKYLEAARAYVRYGTLYGGQEKDLDEKALFNAGGNFIKAGMIAEGITARENFLARFPRSSLRKGILLELGKVNENTAQYASAAKYYDRFAREFPTDVQAPNVLRLSGLYYWAAGSLSDAERMMRKSLKENKSGESPVEADLVELLQQEGTPDRAIYFLRTRLAKENLPATERFQKMMEISQLLAQTHGRLPTTSLKEALNFAEKNHSQIQKSPEGVELVSELKFWKMREKDEAFRALDLDGSEQRMAKHLKLKLAALKGLDKAYTELGHAGGPWALGAVLRLALAYRQFSLTLSEAPIPKSLSGKEIEEYRDGLKRSIIGPFNEKAFALAQTCLKKAADFEILSPWTAQCYELAALIHPESFPRLPTYYLPAVQTALLVPEKAPAETMSGPQYAFYTPLLYDGAERRVSAKEHFDQLIAGESALTLIDVSSVNSFPRLTTYASVSKERDNVLRGTIQDSSRRQPASFSYLDALRLSEPRNAITNLLRAISTNPNEPALHNLLALAYLESGNLPAARITWLSLITRGVHSGAIYNNLGVSYLMAGNEREAVRLFKEANRVSANHQSELNLGFLALKYRNAPLAEKQFSEASEKSSDTLGKMGLAVALVQNRQLSEAQTILGEVLEKDPNEPYVKTCAIQFNKEFQKQDSKTDPDSNKASDQKANGKPLLISDVRPR